MSPTVEERMLKAIGDVDTCPHGHPIFSHTRQPGVPLADVEVGAKVTVLRFENEAEDLLHYLMESGLTPGLEGTLSESNADIVAIESNDRTYSVSQSVAQTVSVEADPSPPPRVALPDQLVLAKEHWGR
jgi:DtxR family Mn-dependent transcriptional regulator